MAPLQCKDQYAKKMHDALNKSILRPNRIKSDLLGPFSGRPPKIRKNKRKTKKIRKITIKYNKNMQEYVRKNKENS